MADSQHWAILGGGFLGMTLALRLKQQGHRVTLFEGASYLGGLASAWTLGDVVWDRHYHVTLLSDSYVRGLLRELELDREMQWGRTRTGFYIDGSLHSVSNALEFLKFPSLGMVDKLRLGLTIFHASRLKNWRKLEQVLVADWLSRWSGRHTLEKIWIPLLRAKLGENYHKASAAFIWAIIVRMYAARSAGMKHEMFGYMPGGYARTLATFEQKLRAAGVEIRLSQPARRVEPNGDGRVRIEFADTHEIVDDAVLTMAAPMAAQICPAFNYGEKNLLTGIEYQGILCASLLLKKPLAGYYITNITDDGVPFTAVIEMSALVDRAQFGGRSLVYLPKYLDPSDRNFTLSDDEIQERFLSALARMYPNFDRNDVLAFRVSRVKYVFPISTLDYSQRVPPIVTSIPGVYVVNSSQIVNGTLNVNETVQLAERAVPQLLEHSLRNRTHEHSIDRQCVTGSR